MHKNNCPVLESKSATAKNIIDSSLEHLRENQISKMNLIWLEATGCSGNIISLLNAENPDLTYLLKEMVDLRYNNSLMTAEGQNAYEIFLETLNTKFILIVEGAVSTKANGLYTIIASDQGRPITAMEAVRLAGEKAKYVLAVGTCASHGGISAASPNPSQSISVGEFLKTEVINVPGCPTHPDWIIGTLAHLIAFGKPALDANKRPVLFYGITIHDHCPRRSYFDKQIFAKKLGEITCLFKLGCRGPVTKTDCPIRRWNDSQNWPIGDNTPCIGCARDGFPDAMEPFIRY